MEWVTAESLRSRLDEFLRAHETVVIVEGDRPRAVLMPVEDRDDLERLLTSRGRDLGLLLDEADRRIDESGGISHDDFWATVESEASQGG